MSKFKYLVEETVFDGSGLMDEQNFYHQGQGSVDQISKTITYLLGSYNENYPISMMTMGNLGTAGASIEINDVQFTYPIMGRDNKASTVSSTSYVAGDKPGIGFQIFKLRFADNWIKRFYIIQSSRGIQARVMEDPVQIGNEYEYSCQLDPAEEDSYCPLTEVQPGTSWIGLYVAVAESESRGSEGKMAAPGSVKNQMGFIRHDLHWAGNAAEKVMKVNMKGANGKETSAWMDMAMWQNEKRWLEERETLYWHSRYNRLADSRIPLQDLITGKVIPRGSGILEQIQNKSTFSKLTYASMVNKVGDALFGQSDTDKMTITLHTGLGGLRDFDEAMKEQGVKLLTDFTGVADKFVTGSMNDLMLGGFFKGFYHIDGYIIKVKHNKIQDMGSVAMASPKHPVTGLPLESHRLTFVDDNDYDGQPNIIHLSQKNRSFLHGVVAGMANVPKSLQIQGGFNLSSNQLMMLNTEVDKSSYHRFHSCGVQLKRANKCFDLECIAGL
jgi:hypothetical protein